MLHLLPRPPPPPPLPLHLATWHSGRGEGGASVLLISGCGSRKQLRDEIALNTAINPRIWIRDHPLTTRSTNRLIKITRSLRPPREAPGVEGTASDDEFICILNAVIVTSTRTSPLSTTDPVLRPPPFPRPPLSVDSLIPRIPQPGTEIYSRWTRKALVRFYCWAVLVYNC